MPQRRAVMVAVPPLLAGMIGHLFADRLGARVIAEFPASNAALRRLPALAPDIVILGDDKAAPDIRAMLPDAAVLVISADLRRLHGPGENDVAEFSADTLAGVLRHRPRGPTI